MRPILACPLMTVFILGVGLSTVSAQTEGNSETTPLELFNQRILPIFRSPEPSSCVQCHLSAVDLKNYIRPSQEKTFASLRDQGLIDLEAPQQSKILTLIRMGEKDLDEGARLIHEKTRQAEYEAFAAWIEACCNDSSLRDLPKLSEEDLAGPDKPVEVIRHLRKSRVVDSFVRNVWSQRMRCFPCHTPHEIDSNNPRHKAAMKTRREMEAKWGDDFLPRLNIFRETPEETLAHLIEQSRNVKEGEFPLLNLENPQKSLILLKPLSKLPPRKENGEFEPPSSAEPVSHMGGLKMHKDDQSYKSFVAWIQDYANIVGDRYVSVEDLPADNWLGTEKVLKLTNTPEDWSVGVPVQLFVHAWNTEEELWNPEPLAFTQGTIAPRKIVAGALFRFQSHALPNESDTDADVNPLSGGRFLVKVYVDSEKRLADDPALLLGEDDFVGQVEFRQNRWRDGFLYGPKVSAAKLTQP